MSNYESFELFIVTMVLNIHFFFTYKLKKSKKLLFTLDALNK